MVKVNERCDEESEVCKKGLSHQRSKWHWPPKFVFSPLSSPHDSIHSYTATLLDASIKGPLPTLAQGQEGTHSQIGWACPQ